MLLRKRIVLCTGILIAVTGITMVIKGQLANPNMKEFTIIKREVTRTLPTGNPHEAISFYGQRQDGSWAKGPFMSSDNTRYGMVRLVLLRPQAQRVVVDDTLHMKTTSFLPAAPLNARTPDPMCGFAKISA